MNDPEVIPYLYERLALTDDLLIRAKHLLWRQVRVPTEDSEARIWELIEEIDQIHG